MIRLGTEVCSSDATNVFGRPSGLSVDPDGRLWIQAGGATGDQGRPASVHRSVGNDVILAADPASGEIRRFFTAPRNREITRAVVAADQRSMFVTVRAPEGTPATRKSRSSQVGPGRSYEPVRTDEEAATELVRLISPVVGTPDQCAKVLVRFLADEVAGPYADLLRLTTDSERPDEAGRSRCTCCTATSTAALRVSLHPAPEIRQPPVADSDGADAALRTRLARIMTLLSDLLWVNDNSPVTFQFRIGRLDSGDGDPVAAAARWWVENREDADEHVEEAFRPVLAADLRANLRNLVRMHLSELFDGSWDGIDEFPELPADHFATFLGDDLIDLVLARTGADARPSCPRPLPVRAGRPPRTIADSRRYHGHVLGERRCMWRRQNRQRQRRATRSSPTRLAPPRLSIRQQHGRNDRSHRTLSHDNRPRSRQARPRVSLRSDLRDQACLTTSTRNTAWMLQFGVRGGT
ncbi:alkaline phosphatase PhoX [Micromonospora sp. CPCC 205546]|uniref:alkaline phosphatase PhoX n=1 Tax=Micromonospora sp. CPCC 205546 TaxID=3122397 RepID=UPI002FF1E181